MPKTPPNWDASSYATVAERMLAFRAAFPDAQLVTEVHPWRDGRVTVRAEIYRNDVERRPAATGWASEREGDGEINVAACLENAETSAVGRALANLGFSGSRQLASRAAIPAASRPRAEHAVHLVREASPAGERADADRRAAFEARQAHADAVKDAQEAVLAAGREGLADADVKRHMRVLTGRSVPPSEIARIERELRAWMDARFPRSSAHTPPDEAPGEPV